MSAERSPARCNLDPQSRDRFCEGTADPRERGIVLRHLFAGCKECSEAVRPRFTLLEDHRPSDFSVSKVLANVAEFERKLNLERQEATELWTDFQRHPVQRQWTLLRNSGRYGLYSFCSILLDASFEAIYDDPRRSLDLAEMALFVASALKPSFHGQRSIHDLLGRAWSLVANARRATSDLLGAEQAIAAAANELLDGTGEPLTEAEHHYYAASIHRAQRRFVEARRSLRRSRRLYRALGDTHLEGRTRLNEALIQELDGDLPGAIERIQTAIPMIDEARDRHLALGARHNLLWCLTAAGRGAEALPQVEILRPRYAELGDQMSLIRLRWMEGRIALQMGRPEVAETAFRECHESFIEKGVPYEAATVAFDLAALFAERGRTAELKALAAELVAVFHKLGVAREAIAALMLFEKTAQAEAVTTALVGKLARYFERARKTPNESFPAEALAD